MKKNKEDPNKYTWIGRFNIVKMSFPPDLMYRFSTVPIKTPASYFVDVKKLIIYWKAKDSKYSI